MGTLDLGGDKGIASLGLDDEDNPQLGCRSIRLTLENERHFRAQLRAVLRASSAGNVKLMFPMISGIHELRAARQLVQDEMLQLSNDGVSFDPHIPIGVMIEVPSAAIIADTLARECDFFSVGTNDLTQMTFAYSRDDAETKFLRHYVENDVLPWNPFNSLDITGVGRLMRIAVEEGRAVNPELPIGLCGEHGGDPKSVAFCHRLGLDYVSTSPYRIPVARLAAAIESLPEAS